MPYSDGNPTLGEQIEEDARIRFYTADLVKEGLELGRENDRLRKALKGIIEAYNDVGSNADWSEAANAMWAIAWDMLYPKGPLSPEDSES